MSTLLALIAVIGAASCESQSERDTSTPAAGLVGHWTQVYKDGDVIAHHYYSSDGTHVMVATSGDRDGEIAKHTYSVTTQNTKTRTLALKEVNTGDSSNSGITRYEFSKDYKTMEQAGPYFPFVYVDHKEKP